MASVEGFQCHTCGKWHEGLPGDYSYGAPYYWVDSLQSDPDSYLSSDACVIKKKDFFVRGLIEVPIIGSGGAFRWGVWVSLSEKNFNRMMELWDDPKIVEEPPYFGWLSSSLELYPNTLGLKTSVESRDVTVRPYITLELTEHPLAVEQHHGITMERVKQIAEQCMHRRQASGTRP